MSRRPKLRASFYDDFQYLLRLGHAINVDPTLPKSWRTEAYADCKALAQKLMNAPERENKTTGQKKAG